MLPYRPTLKGCWTACRQTTLDLTTTLIMASSPGSCSSSSAALTLSSGIVLEKVVEYLHYWYRNRDKEDVPDMDIPVEHCLELLMAADYLGLDRKCFLPVLYNNW